MASPSSNKPELGDTLLVIRESPGHWSLVQHWLLQLCFPALYKTRLRLREPSRGLVWKMDMADPSRLQTTSKPAVPMS
jgi:hypothetical protein